jgi:hypothetical protein
MTRPIEQVAQGASMAKTRGSDVAGRPKSRRPGAGGTKTAKQAKRVEKDEYPPNPPHRPRNPKPTH